MDEQKERIKGYVRVFHRDLESIDDFETLLDYSVDKAVDVTLLYLNREKLDIKFERIVADIVDAIFTKYKKNQSDGVDQAISSMSDNGQSVSFFNEVKNHFATGTDREILQSAVHLLNRYRGVKVGYTSKV